LSTTLLTGWYGSLVYLDVAAISLRAFRGINQDNDYDLEDTLGASALFAALFATAAAGLTSFPTPVADSTSQTSQSTPLDHMLVYKWANL
jgi:hypothetical protein